MTDTVDLQAKGHIDLNLLGFLDGEADFEFFKGDAALNLPDGQPDLSSAALFAMGLDELDLTLGDPDGPHFAITGGSLALATLKPKTPPTLPATDTRSWLAIKGSVEEATFEGLDVIDITVLDFSIEINRATGAYDEDGALTVHAAVNATPLDWATMLNLDRDALFGEDPADRVIVLGNEIDLAGDKLRAAGVIRVNIFDLVVGKVGLPSSSRSSTSTSTTTRRSGRTT